MPSNMTIEVEHLQRGQSGSYGPHVHHSRITVRGEHSWDRMVEEQVLKMAQVLVHPFETSPGSGNWAASRLVHCDLVSQEPLTDDRLGPVQQVWSVKVETPYTD